MSTTTANTFKVGDKVRLNKITKGESLGVWNFLKPWENPRKIFNIVSVEGDYIYVQETAHIGPSGYYYANFELLNGPTLLGEQMLFEFEL